MIYGEPGGLFEGTWRPAHTNMEACIDVNSYRAMHALSQAACCLHIHTQDQVYLLLEIYSILLQPSRL